MRQVMIGAAVLLLLVVGCGSDAPDPPAQPTTVPTTEVADVPDATDSPVKPTAPTSDGGLTPSPSSRPSPNPRPSPPSPPPPSPPPPPATPPPPPPPPTVDVDEVLRTIPTDIRRTCENRPDLLTEPGELVYVECAVEGFVAVGYSRFDSLANVDAYIRVLQANPALTEASEPCGISGLYDQGDDAIGVGEVFCFVSDMDQAILAWTQEDLLTVAVAIWPALEFAPLVEFWGGAGPFP